MDYKTHHIALIVDKSGSMATTAAATLEGINYQIKTMREDVENNTVPTKVSLAFFNELYAPKFIEEDVTSMVDLTASAYRPNGSTALRDAVGFTIEELEKRADKDLDTFLFIIVTDGLENASQVYDTSRLAEMIQERQNTGRWTFTYVGPEGLDLSDITKSMHIPASNVAYYTATTNAGTADAWHQIAASNRNSRSYLRSTGAVASSGYYSGGILRTVEDELVEEALTTNTTATPKTVTTDSTDHPTK